MLLRRGIFSRAGALVTAICACRAILTMGDVRFPGHPGVVEKSVDRVIGEISISVFAKRPAAGHPQRRG